jgi:hypothetical protein
MERTLECDFKTEVDFSCRAERTLHATTVVDFVPRGVDLRCKKRKAHSGKPKRIKNQRNEKFFCRSRLKIATKISLCHRSGLGCDS